jgi:serine/threonine-protein kinase
VATDTMIGTQLGSYRIDEYIGRGGMGVVYRAEHMGLGRRVALKLLAPELAQNESFRERFVRESRLAAAIDHPNVIPIFEAAEVDGNYFIAMRYVDGVDLREVLHGEGALDIDRALLVLGQIAGALDAAHAAGLVHRDVKPGNILVGREFDHCYLTDFGLTKATSSDTNFTATGQFVGTTDYVAPEQIEGRELDRRTDVYSLGCVFYECLAGTPPFRRETDMAVMWAHIQEPPPRLTERRPDLPSQLDGVIATAMAKQKDDRYPSCSTFAAAARSALELGTGRSYAAAQPPPPPPPSASPPPPPPWALPPSASPPPPPPWELSPAASPAPPSPAEELTAPLPVSSADPQAGAIAPPNVWQGPPEVGYAPGWTPQPPPPPQDGGGRSFTAIALIVAALLLAGGGTAAALIVTQKDKPAAKKAAAPQATVTEEASAPEPPRREPRSVTPPEEPQQPEEPVVPQEPSSSAASDAEAAVRDYWETLASGDIDGAFDQWSPPPDSSRSHWTQLRENDGLHDVSFNDVSATTSTSTSATVRVDMVTRQEACPDQHWVFDFYMNKNGGRWQVRDYAVIQKAPC